jgi:PAS domain S-box-containing protein
MFGYARGELVGQPIHVLIPEGLRDRHEHHVAAYTGAPRMRPMGIGMELLGRRKDGTELPVEISLAPIRSERELLITAGIRDVTERRRLERENRRVSGYLVSAVDAVQEAFTLYDERDRVVLVNSLARQLFADAVPGPIVGQTFDQVLEAALGGGVFDFSTETREHLRERWRAYHRAPAGVLEVRTGTGRYLRVTERKTDEHGTVSTIADVTDDVERELELRAASAAKSEFLASMSHELRTPLNAILGFAQLLQRDAKQPLSERQLDRLQYVLRGGEHLLRLIDDVLDLSRIEAGQVLVSLEPVDLFEVLTEVKVTLDPMANRAGIALELSPIPLGCSQIFADRTRFRQILMNYGSNAIKYGRAGGTVAFRATESSRMVRVSVLDDGFGIPLSQQDKVFQPFHRAGQETGPIEGTGIGLTITKRLAELMDGAVGFESTEGEGSAFWIEIPMHHVSEAVPAAPRERQLTESPLSGSLGRRYLIVYIEDNPSNIAFMEDLIADFERVELVTAPTAEIGIELVRARRPHAVIMDINLPGMSGFEATRRLKEWPETAEIPVVALSAAAMIRDKAKVAEAGFFRYLTKPVKVDELVAVLEVLLTPHPPRE